MESAFARGGYSTRTRGLFFRSASLRLDAAVPAALNLAEGKRDRRGDRKSGRAAARTNGLARKNATALPTLAACHVRRNRRNYLFRGLQTVPVNNHRAGGGRNRAEPVTRHRNTGG